jgi:hypothetical protein
MRKRKIATYGLTRSALFFHIILENARFKENRHGAQSVHKTRSYIPLNAV